MEVIGYGVLLAIGFYLAPMIVGVVTLVVVGVFSAIASIFKQEKHMWYMHLPDEDKRVEIRPLRDSIRSAKMYAREYLGVNILPRGTKFIRED